MSPAVAQLLGGRFVLEVGMFSLFLCDKHLAHRSFSEGLKTGFMGSVLGASLGVAYEFSKKQIASFEKQLDGELGARIGGQPNSEVGDLEDLGGVLLREAQPGSQEEPQDIGTGGLQAQLEMQLKIIQQAGADGVPSSGKE
jgi:hypothetical protein